MQLPPHLQARLPSESFTIHRLLGIMPPDGRFLHHADNPLPIDALVVDEASMLDIALATHLLDAVPLHAHIILLGDMDQLSAVEAGAVFSELSADPTLTPGCITRLSKMTGIAPQDITPATPRKPSVLRDSVIWFSDNYRFSEDSGIGKLARQVNTGQSEETLTWLQSVNDPSIAWIEDGNRVISTENLEHMLAGYSNYRQQVLSHPCDIQTIFNAFDRFRILCSVRDGNRGVEEINKLICRQFHNDEREEWFAGRPIMVLRNDYSLKLYNGDIGIALPDGSDERSGLTVYFPDGSGTFRTVAPARLPIHETAFAMTVHKSQGSEFDAILLLMPSRHNRVISRELVYTAITRARSKVTIVSSGEVLKLAIDTPTKRNSGLIRRLEEAFKE
jgi:exodeoxyribonuclease V alpha subunit